MNAWEVLKWIALELFFKYKGTLLGIKLVSAVTYCESWWEMKEKGAVLRGFHTTPDYTNSSELWDCPFRKPKKWVNNCVGRVVSGVNPMFYNWHEIAQGNKCCVKEMQFIPKNKSLPKISTGYRVWESLPLMVHRYIKMHLKPKNSVEKWTHIHKYNCVHYMKRVFSFVLLPYSKPTFSRLFCCILQMKM